jgi:hypothetical protein
MKLLHSSSQEITNRVMIKIKIISISNGVLPKAKMKKQFKNRTVEKQMVLGKRL